MIEDLETQAKVSQISENSKGCRTPGSTAFFFKGM
jgi:hypothetical protein